MSIQTTPTEVVRPSPQGRPIVAPPASQPRPLVPGYDIVGELGRGGMGVVYRAVQVGLNRPVALKMILGGTQLHDADRVRFLAEAEAVAAVKHPNVVQVYEYGHAGGLPYLALEYLDGGSLALALRESGPLPPPAAARLLAQVARGVQAAHDVGVIHRDLKPANILLGKDEGGRMKDEPKNPADSVSSSSFILHPSSFRPKVTDFGLAKRGTGRDLTLTGVVMGTPAYMAPEQATGNAKFVGPAADVYALGVILFECLAGRTPFASDDSHSLLLKVVQEDAPPVRAFAPAVPRDLELICARCLAKSPHERYPSSGALADDLDRFAAGEPVSVRPPGRLERAVRWVKKHPTRAAVYGLAILAVALGAIAGGAISLYRGAEAARAEAVAAKGEAETATGKAVAAKGEAEAAFSREQQALGRERIARLDLDRLASAQAVDLAFRAYEANNPAQARKFLGQCRPEHRTWEWRYVDRLCSREVRIIPTGDKEVFAVRFLPHTGELVTAGTHGVRVWNPQTWAATVVTADWSEWLAASGDGRRMAVAGKKDNREAEVRMFDVASRKPLGSINGLVNGMGLNANGTRLFLSHHDGATVYELAARTHARLPVKFTNAGAMSPDGTRTAVGQHTDSTATVVQVVPIGGGDPVNLALASAPPATAGFAPLLRTHQETPFALALAFSANGTRVAAGCSDGSLVVWDVAGKKELLRAAAHQGRVAAVAFSPDGALVATGGEDRVARVWDVATNSERLCFKGHSLSVRGVAFDLTGTRLATASEDGTVRLWDTSTLPDVVALTGTRTVAHQVAVSDDGTRVATAGAMFPVAVADRRTGKVLWTDRDGDHAFHARILPDQTLLTVSQTGHVRVRNLDTGADAAPPRRLAVTDTMIYLGASADLTRAAGRGNDGAAVVWDARTGVVISRTRPHEGSPYWGTISPDGRRVVTGGQDRTARVWDADTGREVAVLEGHNMRVRAASYSPDGTRLATVGAEGWVKVWDAASHREVLTIRSSYEHVQAVGWSPDGTKLATIDARGTVTVHDAGPRR